MAVMITLAIVITETIYFHLIAHPFEVCFKHIADVGIRVIPVTRSSIIGLVSITVVISAGSETHTLRRSSRCGVIYLVRPADIRSVGNELAVRTEIITAGIPTPTALRIAMVNHDISNHTTAILMDNINHL